MWGKLKIGYEPLEFHDIDNIPKQYEINFIKRCDKTLEKICNE